MFRTDEMPRDEEIISEHAPESSPRRRVHPLTWVAFAAVMPLLGWDVWQTTQDVKHHHQAAQARSLATERLRTAFE